MSATQLSRDDSFWCEPPEKLSHELVLKLNDEDNFCFTQNMKSQCPSTCHSDDSGIEPTLALSPISPLAEDTDSEDGFPRYYSPDNSFHDRYGVLPAQDTSSSNSTSLDLFQVSPSRNYRTSSKVKPTPIHQFWDKAVKGNDNRFQLLSYEEIGRLCRILSEPIKIHSRYPQYPSVEVELRQLLLAVRHNLHALDVPVKDMRINGGVASYIIGIESTPKYNDVDILVSVDLSSNSSTIQKVKTAVLDALMQFLPEGSNESFSNRSTTLSLQYVNSHGGIPYSHQSHHYEQLLLSSATVPVGMSSADNFKRSCCDISAANSNLAFVDMINGFIGTGETVSENVNSCSKTASLVYGSQSLPHRCNCPLRIVDETKMPPNPGSLTLPTMRESYVYKQFRKFSTHESDCWSLLSLGIPETESKVIEFKFVDRMRRQFEFTVDSFQIHLDSMLSFLDLHSPDALNANFYPTVNVECVAGSFSEALYHLKNKLIITREPEMIRGGGLLKYCRLISSGYVAPDGIDICSLERYMSSRFFIDFQDLDSQKLKIESFLHNHFAPHEVEEKVEFLKTFYRVVSGSTVCLMSHERYQTLALTTNFLKQLYKHINVEKPSFCLTDFIESRNLTLDKIYVGKHLFPSVTFTSTYGCSCHLNDSHLTIKQPEVLQSYSGSSSNQTNPINDRELVLEENETQVITATHNNSDKKAILVD